jgi:glycosyltransferase involved in cell wall biosynthesis
LPCPDDVEIIIVNDGSTDQTLAMAEEYAKAWPAARVISKENGGHGSAVNVGLAEAKGEYYKVIDSDDWVDRQAFAHILDILRNQGEKKIDLLVSDYVYDKEGKKRKRVIDCAKALPSGRVFSWEEAKRFKRGQYMLMHSMTVRTAMLRDLNFSLPEKSFYVDNLFAYFAAKHARRMYYIHEVFYHYYVGRADQSVNENVMIKRIDQQIKVNKLMADESHYEGIPKKAAQYLFHYMEIVTAVTTILLYVGGTKKHVEQSRELWDYIKKECPGVYKGLKASYLGVILTLPGELGRHFALKCYKLANRVFGFN